MEFKLNLITPSLYSECGKNNCIDDLSEEFAEYVKHRADNEFKTPCKYNKVPGLAYINRFEDFEERFLIHSEYAVIIVSPHSEKAIKRFLPRLLVFLSSRSIWQNRFLFVVLGDADVMDSLVIHPPIRFSLNQWKTHDETSWTALFELIKVKWIPYIEDNGESNIINNNQPKTKQLVNVSTQGHSAVKDSYYFLGNDHNNYEPYTCKEESSNIVESDWNDIDESGMSENHSNIGENMKEKDSGDKTCENTLDGLSKCEVDESKFERDIDLVTCDKSLHIIDAMQRDDVETIKNKENKLEYPKTTLSHEKLDKDVIIKEKYDRNIKEEENYEDMLSVSKIEVLSDFEIKDKNEGKEQIKNINNISLEFEEKIYDEVKKKEKNKACLTPVNIVSDEHLEEIEDASENNNIGKEEIIKETSKNKLSTNIQSSTHFEEDKYKEKDNSNININPKYTTSLIKVKEHEVSNPEESTEKLNIESNNETIMVLGNIQEKNYNINTLENDNIEDGDVMVIKENISEREIDKALTNENIKHEILNIEKSKEQKSKNIISSCNVIELGHNDFLKGIDSVLKRTEALKDNHELQKSEKNDKPNLFTDKEIHLDKVSENYDLMTLKNKDVDNISLEKQCDGEIERDDKIISTIDKIHDQQRPGRIHIKSKRRSPLNSPTGLVQIASDIRHYNLENEGMNLEKVQREKINILYRGNEHFDSSAETDNAFHWYLVFKSRLNTIMSSIYSKIQASSSLLLRKQQNSGTSNIEDGKSNSKSLRCQMLKITRHPVGVFGMFVAAALVSPHVARLIKQVGTYPWIIMGIINAFFRNVIHYQQVIRPYTVEIPPVNREPVHGTSKTIHSNIIFSSNK